MRNVINSNITATSKLQNDNIQLIDWVSSVYGIYWGVWLGFFLDKMANSKPNGLLVLSSIFLNKDLENYSLVLICSFSILVVSYTFFLVKWMWSVRTLSINSRVSSAINKNKPTIILLILTSGMIILLGKIYSLNVIWIGAGIWATAGWITVIIFVLFSDRRSW